ncbi:MAG TPA: hypothetical protein VFJ22_20215 [Dermatophilaceae bacterium]|nr:hypothetical protein [Dermatophilaceae bacterium]
MTHLGEVVGPGDWPAVFARATWEALQAAMPRVQQAPHGKKVVSLLAGIARCSRCHAPMCSSGWGVRRVCRCNLSVGGCGRTTRNRALVDEWVTRELLGHFSDVVLVDERSAARVGLRRAERAYTDVRWRMVDATTAHEEGRLDGRDFYPIYDRLRAPCRNPERPSQHRSRHPHGHTGRPGSMTQHYPRTVGNR